MLWRTIYTNVILSLSSTLTTTCEPDVFSAAGGRAQLMLLPDIGIHGNSHMLMQDRNNLEIADLLLDWIGRHVTPAGQPLIRR